jgi:ferritin
MAENLIGASVWEDELYEHLTSHVDNERGLLEAYQSASAESGSAAFQYLAALIMEDEIRHHRRFQELASALRTDAEFRHEEPAIPRLDRWGAHPEKVVELTERLLQQERSDSRELKRLEKELRDLKDTTLWQLLVKLMEADTDKHIEILNFVKDHAR